MIDNMLVYGPDTTTKPWDYESPTVGSVADENPPARTCKYCGEITRFFNMGNRRIIKYMAGRHGDGICGDVS